MKEAQDKVMLQLVNEREAEKEAIINKNTELSTSLALAIQQRDDIVLEVEMAKKQHKGEIAIIVELVGVVRHHRRGQAFFTRPSRDQGTRKGHG
jgi:hypothetical protein